MLLSQHQMRSKTKIRHAMACRYINQKMSAIHTFPLQFYILLWGLDLSCPCIFRIDFHAMLRHFMTMKNIYMTINLPFSKGGWGDLNFFLLRHCEKSNQRMVGRHGNPIHTHSHANKLWNDLNFHMIGVVIKILYPSFKIF